MAPILNAQGLSKQFGAQVLFSGLTFTVLEGQRWGIIGPNGAGKSTLLRILSGRDDADSGELALRKNLRFAMVDQDPQFDPELSVLQVAGAAAHDPLRVPVLLSQAGFPSPTQFGRELSGGWRKRLAIVAALAEEPDLLLLDEPTNHLDLPGISWLEDVLARAPFACMAVSHDRYFLERVATHLMEVHPSYPDGLFTVEGNYSRFLEKREEYMEIQARQRESLATVVRREIEWLRRGAKARTRKAKARVDQAEANIASLADMERRARQQSVAIEFTATDRKTKRLITLTGVSAARGGRTLFENLNLVLTPGSRLGVAGANGTGKSTLLRLLAGEDAPDSGTLVRADLLKVVYFDQYREELDDSLSLRRALAPEGDSVLYRGRTIHVNGWARQFLFRIDQLEQPVQRLSGGERARVLLARLMLREADVLLMDEPTNDLDIPTLEVLEQSLTDFPGALVLVTHDRYLMDRIATGILGLDGKGKAGLYADLAQWEAELGNSDEPERPTAESKSATTSAPPSKRKLSYKEQLEWEGIEQRIAAAEQSMQALEGALHAPDALADRRVMDQRYVELQRAQAEVDTLYARWAELAEKQTP